MKTNVESYQTTDILGKSQVELILQVYDGAIKALKTAAEHYQNEKSNDGYEELQKARKFVTHLYTTLNAEKGGDVAENLGKLYTTILCQIDIIEGTKDAEMIRDNMKILSNLREGWIGLRDQNADSPVAQTSGADHINTAM